MNSDHPTGIREVTREEFFSTVGQMNVHPSIYGPYPYTSIFYTPHRVEMGRIVEYLTEDSGLPKSRYYVR